MSSSIFYPPTEVRFMKTLDVEKFSKSITVPCLHTTSDDISLKIKMVKKYLLKKKNLKAIVDEDDMKLIMLDPDVIKSFDDFDENKQKEMNSIGMNIENLIFKSLVIKYENFSTSDVLNAILPPDQEGSTGYALVGHICHLNLREHLFEYKHVIGKVFLDKIPNVQSVVNKLNVIDSTFRHFKMEVLAGSDNMNVLVKENGCKFSFDFSKVYWNSRLCTEHERIVNKVKSHDVIFDVFAGVGPFTIPCARKKCNVFANDLNPDSYNALLNNLKLNKVEKYVEAFNLDGRKFIHDILKENLVKKSKEVVDLHASIKPNFHVVMNLPALAVEFLDEFIGLCKDVDNLKDTLILPTVCCYCFSKSENVYDDAKTLVKSYLGSYLNDDELDVFMVRNVAPNKKMMRVTFQLSYDLLLGSKEHDEPEAKRLRKDIE